jgi:hypothetical protein
MVNVLAVFGVLWIVGRLSRRSRNHPIHAVPELIARNQAQPVLINGPSQETAQIAGSMVCGEGGGE